MFMIMVMYKIAGVGRHAEGENKNIVKNIGVQNISRS